MVLNTTLMSKGLGRIERGILSFMEGKADVETFDIAWAVYDMKPDAEGRRLIPRAKLVSTRRALSLLAKRGMIERLYRGHDRRTYWVLPSEAPPALDVRRLKSPSHRMVAEALGVSATTVARAKASGRGIVPRPPKG
jgi:hypothetical protein